MKFCSKCGGLLLPKKIEGKVVLVCTKCGHVEEPAGSILVGKEIKHSPRELTVVIEKKDIGGTVQVICPKCGYNRAYFWQLQTRAADEPMTRFFKCARCGHIWREYD